MEYSFQTSPEIIEMIAQSKDQKKLINILEFVQKQSKSEGFQIVDYKWQSLVNHINAMIDRSLSGEKLNGIEKSMFEEISEQSIEFAKSVVEMVGAFDQNEMYLLSVHFEVAKL